MDPPNGTSIERNYRRIFFVKMIETSRKQLYSKAIKEMNLPLFFQPWWLELVCNKGNWDVCISQNKEGKVSGVLVFYMIDFFGLKIIRTPPFTPYLGIWLNYPQNKMRNVKRYSFENKIIKELIIQFIETKFL